MPRGVIFSWSYIIFFSVSEVDSGKKKKRNCDQYTVNNFAGLYVFHVFTTCLKFGILCVLIQCRYRVPALTSLSLLYFVRCEIKMESKVSERQETAKQEVARPVPSSFSLIIFIIILRLRSRITF